jgi:trehalose 6-phosphate phosphatase
MDRSGTIGGAALEEALAPLRDDPARSAVMCDIDGTIAPIVERSHEARVPEPQRRLLGELAGTYALVGCASGRPAAEARRLVGIGNLLYIGNHGYECIQPGTGRPELHPDVAPHARDALSFVESLDMRILRGVRLRLEEKGPIAALHWRGVPDEGAAEQRAHEIAAQAEAAGLTAHWGRKVLEVRPPVDINKGIAMASILRERGIRHALYGGDDRTDVDGFRALAGLVEAGDLDSAVCVGVLSPEVPEDIPAAADVTVEGTDGFLQVLRALV